MPYLLGACPKCNGDLSFAEDIFGKYLSCLQCGYLKDFHAVENAANLPARSGGRWESSAAMQVLMEQG